MWRLRPGCRRRSHPLMNKSSVDRFSLNHSQREGNNGNEVQSRSRRLTVRTRSERPRLRTDLPGDISHDAQICIDGAVQRYTETDRRVNCFTNRPGTTMSYAPKYNPNSEMLGGTNVPAATAPTVTVACTSAPASRETDALPDIWGTVFVGHWMFVLNRLVVPEKSTGVVFCESVSLKLFAFLRAASCT